MTSIGDLVKCGHCGGAGDIDHGDHYCMRCGGVGWVSRRVERNPTSDRLSTYPLYTSDMDGLGLMRSSLERISDWHAPAPINCNSLARLLDTIDHLLARIHSLEVALEPFAQISDGIAGTTYFEDAGFTLMHHHELVGSVTLKALRRARSALRTAARSESR